MKLSDAEQRTERQIRSAARTLFELLTRHHLDMMFALATLFWFVAAVAFYIIEKGTNPQVEKFVDALWWSLITMSTVGYGEIVPVTFAGRVVASGLIMGGLAMLGVIIANISALVVRDENSEEAELVSRQLTQVIDRLERLEEKLDEGTDADADIENQSK